MRSNAMRTDTWTSSDAAGLPILPGLVRYDEVHAGAVNHVIRMTIPATAAAYLWPASHQAKHGTGGPPMGTRIRLKATADLSHLDPSIAADRQGAPDLRRDRRRQRLGLVHQR